MLYFYVLFLCFILYIIIICYEHLIVKYAFLIDRTMAKDRVCPVISCYIRNCPKAFGTIPSKAYVLGARAQARIADLSIQTLVDIQSDTKYTPRRYSSLMVFQCIQSLRLWLMTLIGSTILN